MCYQNLVCKADQWDGHRSPGRLYLFKYIWNATIDRGLTKFPRLVLNSLCCPTRPWAFSIIAHCPEKLRLWLSPTSVRLWSLSYKTWRISVPVLFFVQKHINQTGLFPASPSWWKSLPGYYQSRLQEVRFRGRSLGVCVCVWGRIIQCSASSDRHRSRLLGGLIQLDIVHSCTLSLFFITHTGILMPFCRL